MDKLTPEQSKRLTKRQFFHEPRDPAAIRLRRILARRRPYGDDHFGDYPLATRRDEVRMLRAGLIWPTTPPDKKQAILDSLVELAADPMTPAREKLKLMKVFMQVDKQSAEILSQEIAELAKEGEEQETIQEEMEMTFQSIDDAHAILASVQARQDAQRQAWEEEQAEAAKEADEDQEPTEKQPELPADES